MPPSSELPPLPNDAPRIGDVYLHYKHGDAYRVTGLAIDTQTDTWVVVYAPHYPSPAAPLFTRPVHDWNAEVTWNGSTTRRFLPASPATP